MDGKTSNFNQLAYVRRYTLTDGAESGLKIIEVNNGVLRFLLNESKALDMPQLWHMGTNISFVSKNGLTARELPFPRRFEGGMIYTCGLDSLGARDGFEMHGSLHSTPAKVLSAVCNEKEISVTAEIESSELFGKNLLLRRTVSTCPNSDTVTVSDTLINRSAREENYCLLYHVNLGYPMLDRGLTVESDTKTVEPRNAWAKERLADRTTFTDAVDCEEERCYYIEHKTPRVTAVNAKLGKTFTLSYSGDTLPFFVQWNSSASGDYALGLEPSTTFLDHHFAYRTLAPGEEVAFRLEMQITQNRSNRT